LFHFPAEALGFALLRFDVFVTLAGDDGGQVFASPQCHQLDVGIKRTLMVGHTSAKSISLSLL
jgi:hypothetical protein